MAARATGSGTISFGLVSIPVKLFPTVDTTKNIRFNYLSKDGSRLKQQYIRASDGEIVEREDRVQGYEFAKGQYVTFTPEEIKALHIEATYAIEINEFVPLSAVDRLFIEKVYYLGPDKGAARSYHLLRAAMQETGRAGVARYAVRGKCYLVLLRPLGDGLVMEQLKHADELRKFEDVPLDFVEVNEAELGLAKQIVEQIAVDEFEPEKYADETRARMLELIEEKVEGREISVPPEEKVEAKIVDLMEALKASVGKSAAPRTAADEAAAPPTASPRKPKSRSKPAKAGTTAESAGGGEEETSTKRAPRRAASRARKDRGEPGSKRA